MTGLLRKALFVSAVGVLAASNAMAAVPSAADSQVPCLIKLVGSSAGVADARGTYTLTVKDLAGNGIGGSAVAIDFRNCYGLNGVVVDAGATKVCGTQTFAGVTAVCPGAPGRAEIDGVTDANGQLVIRVIGGSSLSAAVQAGWGTQHNATGCATVYADGVNLGVVHVSSFDENGVGGLNPADFSLLLSDSFAFPGTYFGRSDYDFFCGGTANVNPADLSAWLGASFGGGSATSCAAYCN